MVTQEIASGRIDPLALTALESRLLGTLIRPGDDAYDAARQIRNTAIDRSPASIVQARDAADIIRAVAFAREHDLPLAVRSGGHSFAGHSMVDDGLVVDLSRMTAISIDPARQTAWVQPGVTSKMLGAAAAAHGLALTTGDVGTVGLGGLTLGGGIGWMVRKYGLTIDHLRAVELVTADGRLLVASETEHPDLFWALRGGGGNFGIATGFEFQLRAVEQILGGALVLPATADVMRAYTDYALQAPEELTTITFVMHAPPAPFIPAEVHGQLVLLVLLAYVGDPAEGQRVIDGLRAIGQPLADFVVPMPYPGMFEFTKDAEGRTHEAVRSGFFYDLPETAIDAILEYMERPSSPLAMVQIRPLGGAMARVPADTTAFAHRDKRFAIAVINMWQDPAEAPVHHAWTERLWAALDPYAAGVYVNFLADDGAARIGDAYPSATYARLAAVKRQYDPENVFRLNQNIAPAE